MEEVKQYLLDIGFDDAHLPELFNDDDKSYYTIPELMQAYTEHKLKLLGIANINQQRKLFNAVLDFSEELPMCTEDYHRSELWEKYKALNSINF